MNARALWKRYQSCLCDLPKLGFSLDYSRMNFKDNFFKKMDKSIKKAFKDMDALEDGAIANPDEERMVGHYWLRNAGLAPTRSLSNAIRKTLRDIHVFTGGVHRGSIKPPKAKKFSNVLVIGIGGSALGPQFVAQALGNDKDKMKPYFFDNTDPDGIDKTLAEIGGGLKETLCVVISKSGGTPETRNGMLEAEAAFKKAKLDFGRQAVAVTGEGSKLDKYAVEHRWLARFPMWDWVGGRTSELAAVGLLPAALQGLDIDGMLKGAAEMDAATRVKKAKDNPAAILALMWHHATGGKGAKDMVILPYKDRLMLFSKYLQQLVMESLGKEKNLKGKTVYQGIAVYGNKGSTDQHAYVQQLREGVNNFFATFIQVLKDRNGRSPSMDPGVTAGDYLTGFLLGTRTALYENNRESLTITVEQVDAETIGRLIALYERAVGFYATLVNINAYHQPGVEAGKKAAAAVLALQEKVIAGLRAQKGKGLTSEQLARAIGEKDQVETVHKLLEHLAANPDKKIRLRKGKTPFLHKYAL